MNPAICFRPCCEPAKSVAARIQEELAHLDLLAHHDLCRTRAGGFCVAPVAEADAALTAEMEVLAQSLNVLVVSIPAQPLTPEIKWRLLRAGVSDVLDWTNEALVAQQIAARVRRSAEIDRLANEQFVRRHLVGETSVWRALVRKLVEIAAFSSANVLIVGETGTGKELIARVLHALDKRPAKPELVVVDCTTLSPELSGSELFGHERGAFTGALAPRDGAFALANGGTLLLDEIGELPLPLQAQLLRAIQERTYKRVGGNTWHKTEFRLVCATNRDLEQCVRDGAFRADLYYRLADWQLRTPPLRERRADVPFLVRSFIDRATNDAGARIEVDSSLADYLLCRDYPGNVRDLKRIVMRLHARHSGPGPITIGALPVDDRPGAEGAPEPWADPGFLLALQRALNHGIALKEIARAVTNAAIRVALEQEDGNLQRAAKRLGVTDRALQMRRATDAASLAD